MASNQATLDAAIAADSSIPKEAFKVTAGLFYGFAGLSVLARGIIRFITRRPLALDDYLLFLAFASLTAATGLIYSLIDGMYLSTAVETTPALIFKMTSAQVNLILNQALNENVFLVLAWTTTFLVKFSFLAFFRQLIRNVQSIKYYYWGVVALTVVSWMFLTSESFILCSDFGINAVKCLSPSKNLLYISMTGLVTGLDALTDILIVSIPIIVLYRARMRTSQKLTLGAFMSLSLVMVILAITRASKIHGAVAIDVVWEFYWQYMETSVAVIMGSLTVIRNLHVHKAKNSQNNTPALVAGGSSPSGAGGSFHMRRFLRRNNNNNNNNTNNSASKPGTQGSANNVASAASGAGSSSNNNKARMLGGRASKAQLQQTGASTLVDDDSSQLISNSNAVEQSKHGIHVDVEQGQEISKIKYQDSPSSKRGKGWESLEGGTVVQLSSVTTSCTGNNTKNDDY